MNTAAAVFVCSLAGMICFTGCAVQKQWTATGGSRADGTVDLSYEYGMFQKPRLDEAQGVDLAASSCGGWGYTGAQPFGGTMSRCEAVNGYGNCIRFLVTRKYQCMGAPASSATPKEEELHPSAANQLNPTVPNQPAPSAPSQPAPSAPDHTVGI